VWVGGVEVNDYLFSKEKAERLAKEYRDDGYEDVHVDRYDDDDLVLRWKSCPLGQE